jgi:SAM-dependent methyltransferase
MLRRLLAGLRGAPPPPPPPDWRGFDRDTLHHFDAPELPLQPYGLAVPSYALRTEAGTGDLAMFLGIGEAWAQMASRFLSPDPVVLDLGCGCGKLARFLHLNPRLRYLGVDIFLPGVLWCRKAFADASDRFRFEHFDGYSATYNPQGRIAVADYALPTTDGSVDMVVCSSLFTHLLEADAVHYLGEIARVLKPGGQALISIHVNVAEGQVWAGDEERIDVDEAHFLGLARSAGLAAEERIGEVYGQVVHRLRNRVASRAT